MLEIFFFCFSKFRYYNLQPTVYFSNVYSNLLICQNNVYLNPGICPKQKIELFGYSKNSELFLVSKGCSAGVQTCLDYHHYKCSVVSEKVLQVIEKGKSTTSSRHTAVFAKKWLVGFHNWVQVQFTYRWTNRHTEDRNRGNPVETEIPRRARYWLVDITGL